MMKHYLVGFAVGIASFAAVQYGISTNKPLAYKESKPSFQTTSENVDPDYVASFSGAVINPLFETDRPTTDMFEPFKNSNFPLITLDSISELQSFSRKDIQSVCLAHIDKEQTYHSFTVNIFLKPEARRLLGKTLAIRGGQEHAFRVLGYSVNSFFVDEAKASYLIDHAETYPLYPYDKASEVTDDNTFLLDHPDISIAVEKHAIAHGLMMAKYASGTNDLKPCTSQDVVSFILGYDDHLIYWKKLQEEGYFPDY